MPYWIHENGETIGPFSAQDVLHRAKPETLVSNGQEWIRFDQHPRFAGSTVDPKSRGANERRANPVRKGTFFKDFLRVIGLGALVLVAGILLFTAIHRRSVGSSITKSESAREAAAAMVAKADAAWNAGDRTTAVELYGTLIDQHQTQLSGDSSTLPRLIARIAGYYYAKSDWETVTSYLSRAVRMEIPWESIDKYMVLGEEGMPNEDSIDQLRRAYAVGEEQYDKEREQKEIEAEARRQQWEIDRVTVTAQRHYDHPGDLDTLGLAIAEDVWELAHQNPAKKRLVLVATVHGVNRYGEPTEVKLPPVIVDDLDTVRRYRSKEYFFRDNSSQANLAIALALSLLKLS